MVIQPEIGNRPVAPGESSAGPPGAGAVRSRARTADLVYYIVLLAASLVIFAIVAGLAIELFLASRTSMAKFGWHFFANGDWDPVRQIYSAGPFVLGTLYSSFWALLLAVPVSVGAAVFLSEVAPRWARTPFSFLVELLAAVPSVVYGLWGIFVLVPWLVKHVETPVSDSALLSRLFLFQGAPNGNDMLAASLVLAIMITPIITAISRDIIRAIPASARAGSYALGATRWETIKRVVLPYARAGIIGAVILGLGRALGETMAVTMVIGNSPGFHTSLFSPGYTMASVIANEFTEAPLELYRSALIEIGLILLLVTTVVNGLARLLVYYAARSMEGGGRRA